MFVYRCSACFRAVYFSRLGGKEVVICRTDRLGLLNSHAVICDEDMITIGKAVLKPECRFKRYQRRLQSFDVAP